MIAQRCDHGFFFFSPRYGPDVIGNVFVALKTPIDPQWDDKIALLDRFRLLDFLREQRKKQREFSLVINLTNTNKYYTWDPAQVAAAGFDNIEFWHCKIPGRRVPESEEIEEVIAKIDESLYRHPEKKIAIHCTHGVNRTGFFVIAYLTLGKKMFGSLHAAQKHFEECRGERMKRDYLLEGLERILNLSVPEGGAGGATPSPREEEVVEFRNEGAGVSAAKNAAGREPAGRREDRTEPPASERERAGGIITGRNLVRAGAIVTAMAAIGWAWANRNRLRLH